MGSEKGRVIIRGDGRRANPFNIHVKRKGFKVNYFSDIFHLVLASSWSEFFIVNTILYLCMNLFYASLYYIGGDSILNADPLSFWDAFVFSFQTSTTIGYGHFLPATQYADIIVILDTLSSIVYVAITTGLAFAKLSLPTARVEFTESCVVHQFEGKNTLMFRVANGRDSHIADTSIEAVVVLSEKSEEGITMERIHDLKLVRHRSPIFFMSWSVMHIIDESSPLYGIEGTDLNNSNLRVVISLTGIDDWSSQNIHASHIYYMDDIVIGKQFADILTNNKDGSITMDYDQFNVLKNIE